MSEVKYAAVSVRLTEQERKLFKMVAAKKDSTMSELVRKFVQESIKEEGLL